MNSAVHNQLVSFIWSVADDCLRDVYVRGKYRDVILPMFVLRRLDALLEPTKEAVLAEYEWQKADNDGKADFDHNLVGFKEAAGGLVFYNISPFTLEKLARNAGNNPQLLVANIEEYLRGFSANVTEIIDRFELRNKIRHMASKNVLLDVLEKFTSPYINLTPHDKTDPEGRRLPGLSNLGMGYVFEELIRRFNEENNEEAGEHYTPREVINLMTHLTVDPVADQLPGMVSVYDPACGTGGMLTECQNYLSDPEGLNLLEARNIILYGKEINDETYAICKSDMMIKGGNPQHIHAGSTLAADEFAGQRFHFMLSNPPYGKSWVADAKYIKDGKDVIDRRFKIQLKDYWGQPEDADAVPRTSDGQLLFLMEMVSKMKHTSESAFGSRIATVHNGSALFTGDAGSGESNIRHHLLERDLIEAIIQLPNNIFYNTGITTYIWLLSNHKAENRRGLVQLIDASQLYRKLRKNLGAKNCELAPEHIAQIMQAYTACTDIARTPEGTLASRVFQNQEFGYYKVTIERPRRLRAQFSAEALEALRFDKNLRDPMQYAWQTWGEAVYANLPNIKKELLHWCEVQQLELKEKQLEALVNPATWERCRQLHTIGLQLMERLGTDAHLDCNLFFPKIDRVLKDLGHKLSAPDRKAIIEAITTTDPAAQPVIKTRHRLTPAKLDALLTRLDCMPDQLPDYGYYPVGKDEYVEYESDSDLRDTEAVPLLGDGIYNYFQREVQPHVPDAWINIEATKIGYEISFNKYFYQHKPLRTLNEVTADILQLERESEGLIMNLLNLA